MTQVAVLTNNGTLHQLVEIAYLTPAIVGDNYGWRCKCGRRGISSSEQWAIKDHARHIRNSGR